MDGRIAAVGAPVPGRSPRTPRSSTPPGSSPCRGPRGHARPPARTRAGRTPGARGVRHPGRRRGGYTAVFAMAELEPVADTAGVGRQIVGSWAGTAGWADVRAGWAPVTVGLEGEQLSEIRAMAESRAGVQICLRRRQVRARPRPDAPGPGVRQGLRRRRRQHAQEPPPDRGRPDRRGRVSADLGLTAGPPSRRRRSSPATSCSPTRGLPAAHLPPLHGRVRGDGAVGRGARRDRDRRGHPAPPAAHRRAGAHVEPRLRGQSAAARGRRHQACAVRWPRGTIERDRRGTPHRGGQVRVELRRHGMTGLRRPPWPWSRHRPRGHRDDRVGAGRAGQSPRRPARSSVSRTRASLAPGSVANIVLWDPAGAARGPGAPRLQGARQPVPGMTLPGGVRATFYRGHPVVRDGELTTPVAR
ncbi:hypothetical protein QJS66_03960 [Kocuria rhizophila]|nr:hypothetical protein QJS66_03960 [Kocuria rhizophila]